MTARIDADFVAIVARSLALGTARAPLDAARLAPGLLKGGDRGTTLKLMALAGQARRFAAPALPGRFDAVAPRDERGAIVPEAARALLIRLALDGHDAASLAVAEAMERRCLAPHPFDLPRLEKFVRVRVEQLGAGAARFVARDSKDNSEEIVDWFAAEAPTDDTWHLASPARKATYIRDRRAEDPERGLSLVEAVFKTQNAASRQKLLEALSVGLSEKDVPFLDSLAGDRAPTVKAMAAGLVARIPGTPAFQARLNEALSRLKVVRGGILRQKLAVRIEFPANVDAIAAPAWASRAFDAIPLATLAGALGISQGALVEAALGEEYLRVIVARQAGIERRFDLIATITRRGGHDIWQHLLTPADAASRIASRSDAEAWVAAVLAPELWSEMPASWVLAALHAHLRRPLPVPAFRALVASRAWREFLAKGDEPAWTHSLPVIAALTPAAQRADLRRDLAAPPATATARALLLLDCLDLLDPP